MSCNIVSKSNKAADYFFSACCLGKSCTLPFVASQTTYNDPLELLFFPDVWGPASVQTNEGFHYYVHFTDVATKFTWFYPLKHKSYTLTVFIHFKTISKLHTGRKIRNF